MQGLDKVVVVGVIVALSDRAPVLGLSIVLCLVLFRALVDDVVCGFTLCSWVGSVIFLQSFLGLIARAFRFVPIALRIVFLVLFFQSFPWFITDFPFFVLKALSLAETI